MGRKLKKMLQKRKMDPQEEEKQNKILPRHQKDHLLLPFAGLNPEYMEMSEWSHRSFTSFKPF